MRMMRIRSIWPEFWTDEAIVTMGAPQALLYVGLWNFADDEGRFWWDCRMISAALDPLDTKFGGRKRVEELLLQLATAGRLTSYDANGKTYGVIHKFKDFQHPKRPKPSGIPPPPWEADVPPQGDQGEPVGRQKGDTGEPPLRSAPIRSAPLRSSTGSPGKDGEEHGDSPVAAAAVLPLASGAPRP